MLSVLFSLVLSTAAPAIPSDPVSIANAIYERAIRESGGQFIWVEAKDRPKYFSKSLVALWTKADAANPEGSVDFDLVTNSQDPDVTSFKSVAETRTANTATVAVTLTEKILERKFASDRTVRYDFVREGGRWKIDDIRSTAEGRPWSLREILSTP